jgi:uncharacterized repeat protein (TIGR01451 family)
MKGRVAGTVAAVLLAGGMALAGEVPAIAPPPQPTTAAGGGAGSGSQPVLEVQQRMPEWVNQGELVPIDIVITNTGGAPAESVTVSSTLPPSLDLREAAPLPERVRGSLWWTLGPLAPGQQHVVRLRVMPRGAAAEVRNAVRVTYQSSVISTGATGVRRAVLELTVNGPEGGAVSYQILVRNTGSAPARDVALQALLPPGLAHPGGRDLENPLGTLGPGEARQIALHVTPTQAGDLRQRIRVCAAGTEPVEREACLRVQEVKVALVANGPRLLYENWPASFELALRNEGTEVVPQARLTVRLPEGIAFVRATDNGVYDPASHSISWDLGDLRPGEERTPLWNGVARGVGDQPCEVTVASGSRVHKRLTWQTNVAKGSPAPPPAGGSVAPAADRLAQPPPPVGPELVPPAPVPPQLPAPPPEPGAAGLSAAPPRPESAESSAWRPVLSPSQLRPTMAGAPASSP